MKNMKTFENFNYDPNKDYKPGYIYLDIDFDEYYIFIGYDTKTPDYPYIFNILKEQNQYQPYFYFFNWNHRNFEEIGPMKEYIYDNLLLTKTIFGMKKKSFSGEGSSVGKKLIKERLKELESNSDFEKQLRKEEVEGQAKKFKI